MSWFSCLRGMVQRPVARYKGVVRVCTPQCVPFQCVPFHLSPPGPYKKHYLQLTQECHLQWTTPTALPQLCQWPNVSFLTTILFTESSTTSSRHSMSCGEMNGGITLPLLVTTSNTMMLTGGSSLSVHLLGTWQPNNGSIVLCSPFDHCRIFPV